MDLQQIQVEARAVSDQVFNDLVPTVEVGSIQMAECLKAGGKMLELSDVAFSFPVLRMPLGFKKGIKP